MSKLFSHETDYDRNDVGLLIPLHFHQITIMIILVPVVCLDPKDSVSVTVDGLNPEGELVKKVGSDANLICVARGEPSLWLLGNVKFSSLYLQFCDI